LLAQAADTVPSAKQGDTLVYVKRGKADEVWLRRGGGKARRVIGPKELKSINFAYASRVVGVEISPTGKFFFFQVHDGDVSRVTAIFDLQSDKAEVLLAPEGDTFRACWHPKEDVIYFAAGESIPPTKGTTLYSLNLGTRERRRLFQQGTLNLMHAGREGLELSFEVFDQGVMRSVKETVPYEAFLRIQ